MTDIPLGTGEAAPVTAVKEAPLGVATDPGGAAQRGQDHRGAELMFIRNI